jgi:hypothetical protein
MVGVDENAKMMVDRAGRTRLCRSCANWDLRAELFLQDTLSSIQMASRSCALHKLVYDACVRIEHVREDSETIYIRRLESHLFLEGMDSPLLSLCRFTGASFHFPVSGKIAVL